MADANRPNVNLIRANTSNEFVTPATRDDVANPIMPIASIHFLFHPLDKSLMNIFETAYATLNIKDAIRP